MEFQKYEYTIPRRTQEKDGHDEEMKREIAEQKARTKKE